MNQASITYRKLQAPSGNGDCLIEPPISESLSYLHANHQRFAAFADIEIGGLSFTALRQQARNEIIGVGKKGDSLCVSSQVKSGQKLCEPLEFMVIRILWR